MRALIAILAISIALVGGAPAFAQKNGGRGGGNSNGGGNGNGDPVVYFSNDDAQMNAAMAEAKRTLPQFWLLFGNDEIVAATGAVKIGFPYGKNGGFEYMWVSDLRRDKGVLKGRLDNSPNYDVGYSEGDTVIIKTDDIVDWTYIRNGRMYGGYTLRVMLREMSPEDAREMNDYLSDRPLEGDQI